MFLACYHHHRFHHHHHPPFVQRPHIYICMARLNCDERVWGCSVRHITCIYIIYIYIYIVMKVSWQRMRSTHWIKAIPSFQLNDDWPYEPNKTIRWILKEHMRCASAIYIYIYVCTLCVILFIFTDQSKLFISVLRSINAFSSEQYQVDCQWIWSGRA